ncbi:unnamed protein product [Urochloa humidicola]
MARSARALLLPLLLLLLALARAGKVPAAASLGWELGVVGTAEDDEFGFLGGDSVARRVLQGGGYFSYGALRKEGGILPQLLPRSAGQPLRPYSRGCSTITR